MSTPIKQGIDSLLGLKKQTPISQLSNDGVDSLRATLKGSWEKIQGLLTDGTLIDICVIGALTGILFTMMGGKKWGSRITILSMLGGVILGVYQK